MIDPIYPWAPALVGQKLLEIFKDGDDVILVTDKGKFKCVGEGECCKRVYVDSVEAPDLGSGALVTAAEHRQRRRSRDPDCNESVTDYDFYVITTTAGHVDIELRTEHNGYYSGELLEPVPV